MKRARWATLSLVIGGVLLVAGCGSRAERQPAEKRVAIEAFAFRPATLAVSAGTEIVWVQKDPIAHTVTSGDAGPIDPETHRAEHTMPDGRFDSKDLEKGAQFRFRFSEPSVYSYFCMRHPEGMRGEIQVTRGGEAR